MRATWSLKTLKKTHCLWLQTRPHSLRSPPEILGKNNEKYIQISVDFFLQNGKNHPIVNQFCPVNCFMKQSSQHADRFVRPDVVTYGSAIAACASGTHWQQATGPTVVTVGDLGPTIAKIVFPLTAADLEMFRGRYIWHIVINCIYCIPLDKSFIKCRWLCFTKWLGGRSFHKRLVLHSVWSLNISEG